MTITKSKQAGAANRDGELRLLGDEIRELKAYLDGLPSDLQDSEAFTPYRLRLKELYAELVAKNAQILKCGRQAMGARRAKQPLGRLILTGADLHEADLRDVDLRAADLRGANLSRADLRGADLREADLSEAGLSGANLQHANLGTHRKANYWEIEGVTRLSGADLSYANLSRANLVGVEMPRANLRSACLRGADLTLANLSGDLLVWTNLRGANLTRAGLVGSLIRSAEVADADFSQLEMGMTEIADVDLSSAKGLESVRTTGPCSIGIDTIYKSKGRIPDSFLRGCGVTPEFIAMIPSLVGVLRYPSCFISYSGQDKELAERLYERMKNEGLSVWMDTQNLRRGQKVLDQIENAINSCDRLLVLLSKHSMESEWVKLEIAMARRWEQEHKRRKLFPIAMVPYRQIQQWQCLDPHTGEDIASEIRQYFLADDFANWKEHDSFERAFATLLRDLQAGSRGSSK